MAKWSVSAVLGAISAFVLSLPTAVQTLGILMAADYLTGCIVAAMKGKLSSKTGLRGLAMKALIFILVAVAHLVAHTHEFGFDLGAGVALFFSVNELISIVENCHRGGVRIPPLLLAAIGKLEQITGDWDGIEKRTESRAVENERRKR